MRSITFLEYLISFKIKCLIKGSRIPKTQWQKICPRKKKKTKTRNTDPAASTELQNTYKSGGGKIVSVCTNDIPSYLVLNMYLWRLNVMFIYSFNKHVKCLSQGTISGRHCGHTKIDTTYLVSSAVYNLGENMKYTQMWKKV